MPDCRLALVFNSGVQARAGDGLPGRVEVGWPPYLALYTNLKLKELLCPVSGTRASSLLLAGLHTHARSPEPPPAPYDACMSRDPDARLADTDYRALVVVVVVVVLCDCTRN